MQWIAERRQDLRRRARFFFGLEILALIWGRLRVVSDTPYGDFLMVAERGAREAADG